MRAEARLEVAEVLTERRRYALVVDDAVSAMGELPAQSIDLAFADPPYNLSNGGTTNRGGKRVVVDKAAWDASRGLMTDHAFNLRWLAAAQRVLKPSGTIWVSGTHHAIFSIGWAMQTLGYHILNTVTWYKANASPHLACRMFTHSTELLLWAAPAKLDPLPHHFDYEAMKAEAGGRQMRDVWPLRADGSGAMAPVPAAGSGERQAGGQHPTQKPLALLERVVLASSQPGQLVLDPFNGSGTTGVVALQHGRRFIGVDLDAGYIEASVARLAGVRRAS